MDWVILALLVIVLAFLLLVLRKLDRVEERQRITLKQIHDGRARQASTTHRFGHQSTPSVDARAVTTRRDTDDLPLTGRMSTALHRPRRDYASPDTNG